MYQRASHILPEGGRLRVFHLLQRVLEYLGGGLPRSSLTVESLAGQPKPAWYYGGGVAWGGIKPHGQAVGFLDGCSGFLRSAGFEQDVRLEGKRPS